MNISHLIKRFVETDSEHKIYYLRTYINHLMAKIGRNNQFDYVWLKKLYDSNKLAKQKKVRKVELSKVIPSDLTHNLICQKCKFKFFDFSGGFKKIDITKAICPSCRNVFNGLDRKYWSMKSEDVQAHFTGIEAIKRKMKKGWKPEPVELYYDKKTRLYYKLHGFKRMIAHIELGKKYINAIVSKETLT